MAHMVVAGLFQDWEQSWHIERVSGFHAAPPAGL